MEFTPSISTTVANGVLTVTDTSNYTDNQSGVYKENLYFRNVAIKDAQLGTTYQSKMITYGNDSVTFDLSLLQVISVNIQLVQSGISINYSTEFLRYLNI